MNKESKAGYIADITFWMWIEFIIQTTLILLIWINCTLNYNIGCLTYWMTRVLLFFFSRETMISFHCNFSMQFFLFKNILRYLFMSLKFNILLQTYYQILVRKYNLPSPILSQFQEMHCHTHCFQQKNINMVQWSLGSYRTQLWATSWENLFMPYANNKGADQPAQSDQRLHCSRPR